MRMFLCTGAFAIELVDDDGFHTEKLYEVQKGSLWELSDDPYRLVGGDDTARLKGVGPAQGMWLEITQEHLAIYFEEVDPYEDSDYR